jgi:hypothetical protein
MATREPIIRLRLEDKDAVARLGKLAIEANEVRTSMKDLKAEIKETGTATTDQARQMGELVARQKNLSGQSRELSNDLSGLTAAGMRFRDKMADATLEAIKQSGILGQLGARSDTLTAKLDKLNAEYKEGKVDAEQYKAQQDVLQKELSETTAAMTKMDAKLDELNKDFKEGKITAEQFKAGVASVNAETQKAAGVFSKGIGDLKNYAMGMFGVVAAVQGLRAVYGNVVGIIRDFDKAQSNLAAIMNTTKAGVAELTREAIKYGSTTVFTASQVTQLQTELAKLGFTQNQVKQSTAAVLDLAAATGTDLANAATIAAQTLNAFQLDASETGRVVDVIAKSANLSAFNVDTFSAAMSNAAPAAKAVGIEIEEAAAMLSALVDAGIPAEKAGTDLRNIFISLAKEGKTLDQAYKEIQGSTNKLTTAVTMFDQRAAGSALILADNTEKVDRLKEAYDNAAGSAAEMAKTQLDNLAGDQLLLTSAWEGFVLSVDQGSGVISKSLRGITSVFTDIIGYLTILNSTDVLGSGGTGKGSVVAAEQATKNYRKELERLIAKEAEALGWKSKEEGVRIALMNLSENEINAMREKARVTVERAAKEGVTEEALLKVRQRIAAIDANIAAARDGRERTNLFQKNAAKRAELTILLTQLEAKASAETAAGTKVVDEDTETTIENTDAKTKQAAAVRVLTDELRAFIKAQKDIESGVGIGQMRTIGGIGSQSDIGTPESRLLAGPDISERTAAELASIAEVRAAQEAADEARMTAMQQTFNMLTSLGQLAKEGSTEAKVLAVAQAVAGAYLAVINALATFDAVPDPTGAVKFAKAASIGAAAFAAVARIKNAVGFEEGGYTSRASSDKKPVGVVHANEYVVPAPVLRNPKYAAMVEELERARRGYGLRSEPGSFAAGGPTGMWVRGYDHGMVTNPRPTPGEVRAIENAARMGNAPIFVRVEEINQVQGRVARIAERSTL